jgi:glutamate synthase (ferredoxin)
LGVKQLQEMIANHVAKTGSPKGKEILDNWDSYLGKFWQVVPPSEADSPEVNANAAIKEIEQPLTSV